MPTTPGGLPYPSPSDSADVPGDMQALAEAVESGLSAKAASAHNHDAAYVAKSIVDAKGDLLVGTADNTVGVIGAGSNGQVLTVNSATASGLSWATVGSFSPAGSITGGGSSNTTSYTTLGGGPAVTVTTGTSALVIVSCSFFVWANNAGGAVSGFASFAVSGATTLAANDSRAARVRSANISSNNTGGLVSTYATLLTGLTPGSNTFTMQFRADDAPTSFTHSYNNPSLVVIPV